MTTKSTKRTYVASRLRAETPEERAWNLAAAAAACSELSYDFELRPFAPHLFYTSWLEARDEAQDAKGIALANDDLLECDHFAFFVDSRGLSRGMKAELELLKVTTGKSTKDLIQSGKVLVFALTADGEAVLERLLKEPENFSGPGRQLPLFYPYLQKVITCGGDLGAAEAWRYVRGEDALKTLEP